MALSLRRKVEPITPPTDDYQVEGEAAPARATTGAQVVHVLQVLLIVVLALLSFAVFWLIGLLLNIV
jgi:hypothetical protein